MESITVGQIAAALALIVAVIAGIKSLKKDVEKWIIKVCDEKFNELQKKINDQANTIKEQGEALKRIALKNSKAYLMTCLTDIETSSNPKSESDLQKFWAEYEYYILHGGDGYVKTKIERLQKMGML